MCLLAVFLVALAGCKRTPEGGFHADSLKVDDRYAQEIHLVALGERIRLKPNAYVRVDPPVNDPAEHVQKLLRELGVRSRRITYSNPARNGGQMHLRFRDGKECSFIWVRRDPDSRITRARLEHEKYHAVCRLAPEAIPVLSARLAQMGFAVNLADLDEELAATVIEILSLHVEGVALAEIHGSELTEKAVTLLQRSQSAPDQEIRSASAPEKDTLHVTIAWPEGKSVIELPLEYLDDVPVIRCQINRKPAILYLDTGSQATCMYQDRLERFGIRVAGEVDWARYTASGKTEWTVLSGEYEVQFADGLSLKVSGAMCLPGAGRDPDHDVDGILGTKVVKALHAVIDLGQHKVVLRP